METSRKNDDGENTVDNIQNKSELKERSETNMKLIEELTIMGFSKSAILNIVDNTCNIPKDVIVEQLLVSNYDPENWRSIPVVDDDCDQLWEDVTISNKMVIVMNTGLNMGVGKIASQAAHAALGLYEVIKERTDLINDLTIWNDQGSRKIVVEAKNTNELIKLCSLGKLHKIPFFCVHDDGLTEVEPDSFTAIAFFGSDDQLKSVTGKLRLLK